MASRVVSFLSTRLAAVKSSCSRLIVRRYCQDPGINEKVASLNVPRRMRPSKLDKYVLVKTKVYTTTAEIPDQITVNQMNYAKDRFRAKMMVPMMIATMLGFYLMMIEGRKLIKSGDSLTLRGTVQVAEWQEKHRRTTADGESGGDGK